MKEHKLKYKDHVFPLANNIYPYKERYNSCHNKIPTLTLMFNPQLSSEKSNINPILISINTIPSTR